MCLLLYVKCVLIQDRSEYRRPWLVIRTLHAQLSWTYQVRTFLMHLPAMILKIIILLTEGLSTPAQWSSTVWLDILTTDWSPRMRQRRLAGCLAGEKHHSQDSSRELLTSLPGVNWWTLTGDLSTMPAATVHYLTTLYPKYITFLSFLIIYNYCWIGWRFGRRSTNNLQWYSKSSNS